MNKEDFKILMYALYGNKQLIIPDGQTLQEWIDYAFVEKQAPDLGLGYDNQHNYLQRYSI